MRARTALRIFGNRESELLKLKVDISLLHNLSCTLHLTKQTAFFHTLQYRLHYNRLYVYGRRIVFVDFLITCSKNHKKFRLFVQCLSDTEQRPLLGRRNATSEDHELYS